MEKRAILAFALSMLIFIGWTYFFGNQGPPPEKKTEAAGETKAGTRAVTEPPAAGTAEGARSADAPSDVPAKGVETLSAAQARDITVTTELFTAVFSESGGRLKSITLNKYRLTQEPGSPAKELVLVSSIKDIPLGLSFQSGRMPYLKTAKFSAETDGIDLKGAGKKASLVMTYQDPGGLTVQRTYSFQSDSYLIEASVNLRNFSNERIDDSLVLELNSGPITNKQRYAGFAAYIDGKLFEVKPGDLEDDLNEVRGKKYHLDWAGYQDQYFLAGILPENKETTRFRAVKYGDDGVSIQFVNPPVDMPSKTEMIYRYEIFYGPKDYKLLKSIGKSLDKSINFGWMDVVSKPLLWVMTRLHGVVGNYGVVIIIVTILIKILFWPLTAKSYKSMKEMQKLQPKIMKLREKYKDDREAMNREMMQMYKAYKVNPLGGCLPMVIQIPVFIALYRLLDYSLELRHAPFALWITDLAAPDRLLHFDFKVPLMEAPTGIPVLTLLMGASMLLQQKMTPTPGDPTQAKMMMLMPVFFTFIFINFPSGLVLYWLVNNVLSIGQQTLINKRPS